MEDFSPTIVTALGLIAAAFGIWLTVRLVNRGKKPSAKFCRCVVIVVSVGALSICLSIWLPYHREQQIVQKIEGSGGIVVHRKSGGPDWLRRLAGEYCMYVFSRVDWVNLDGSTITDADMIQVGGLTELVVLHLGGTQVTDAGVIHLTKLRNLEMLTLGNTNVTDPGLACLAGLVKIRWLNLDGTQVGNAGLTQLSGLPELNALFLRRTQVTADGATTLQKAIPGCVIRL